MDYVWFEGVCVTAVILAPGACGMGGPSRGSCHHFRGSRSSRGSRGIRNELQIVRKPHVFTVKTSPDPPLNPPKAQHSSGRPWESLWEGLEELWESLKISKTPTFWVWRSAEPQILPTSCNSSRIIVRGLGLKVSDACLHAFALKAQDATRQRDHLAHPPRDREGRVLRWRREAWLVVSATSSH